MMDIKTIIHLSLTHIGRVKYKPQSKFIIDGNLVYNTREIPHRYRDGRPALQNDVAINFQMGHLPDDVQAEIKELICNALNNI